MKENFYICVLTYIIMTNITISIPNNVFSEMKDFSEIKWSEVARKAILSKLEILKFANKLVSKSKFTNEDVLEISNEVKKSANKRFL
jgi:hypothetical protein